MVGGGGWGRPPLERIFWGKEFINITSNIVKWDNALEEDSNNTHPCIRPIIE